MIQMKMGNEKDIYDGRINLIKVWQSSHAGISRVNSTIKQDYFAFVRHVNARPADFISGS